MAGPGPGGGTGTGFGVTYATRSAVRPLASWRDSSTLTTATVYSTFSLSPGKRVAMTGLASMLVTLPMITQSTAGTRWAPAAGSMMRRAKAVEASDSRQARPASFFRRMGSLRGMVGG